VDILLAETMNSIREISAVLNQIHPTGYEYCVSFVCRNEELLFSGESIKDVMRIIGKFSPQVVMINCIHPELAGKIIQKLRLLTDRPVGVYCNIGNPDLFEKDRFEVCVTPEEYYDYAAGWKEMGVRIIGGCCGTTPEYIRKLSKLKVG
jgi:5-methyltetrahydrofolate--homocysteine methyltransferase